MQVVRTMNIFDFFKGDQPPLVEEAFSDVKHMLDDGHEMFDAASAHLLNNEILDIDLSSIDQKINQREQDLRRSVLEHLTIDPDRELVFSLKLISIVHEAERIGDLAKSLARTGDLAEQQRMGESVEPLRDIRRRILKMFERAKKGFVENEVSAARRLMHEHERIKDDTTAYLQQLAARGDLTSNEGVVYALSAYNMSRVSSHLSNIASTVVSPFDRIRRSPAWAGEEGEETPVSNTE